MLDKNKTSELRSTDLSHIQIDVRLRLRFRFRIFIVIVTQNNEIYSVVVSIQQMPIHINNK